MKTQRGIGAITAVLVLVALSVLAAAIVRLSSAAQSATAQDVMAARASAAARAGLEWGLYQAFKGSWSSCAGATQTLDLRADTGLMVSVTCDSRSYHDGESAPGVASSVRVFVIEATACSLAASCPDAAAAVQPGYVERRLQIVAAL
ncbi:MAG: MSHA biogenesis protein MshP [Burkholderiaceae bacterium]